MLQQNHQFFTHCSSFLLVSPLEPREVVSSSAEHETPLLAISYIILASHEI
uniref:Uncharacterized protein n=1 Tax=Heterorhabditis bacteriophora TaxID=37862 RepID=A0A1I7W840_HETBA